MPTRIGKKKKRTKGPEAANKLPQVLPHTRCRLKLLRQERIKDYLLMEEEFIRNQEQLRPQEEKHEVYFNSLPESISIDTLKCQLIYFVKSYRKKDRKLTTCAVHQWQLVL